MGVEEVAGDHASMTDVDQGAVGSDVIRAARVEVVSEVVAIVTAQGEDSEVVVGREVSDQAVVVVTAIQDHRRRVGQEVMSAARTLVVRAAVVVAAQATVPAQGDHMTVQEAPKAADSKLKDVIFPSSLAR